MVRSVKPRSAMATAVLACLAVSWPAASFAQHGVIAPSANTRSAPAPQAHSLTSPTPNPYQNPQPFYQGSQPSFYQSQPNYYQSQPTTWYQGNQPSSQPPATNWYQGPQPFYQGSQPQPAPQNTQPASQPPPVTWYQGPQPFYQGSQPQPVPQNMQPASQPPPVTWYQGPQPFYQGQQSTHAPLPQSSAAATAHPSTQAPLQAVPGGTSVRGTSALTTAVPQFATGSKVVLVPGTILAGNPANSPSTTAAGGAAAAAVSGRADFVGARSANTQDTGTVSVHSAQAAPLQSGTLSATVAGSTPATSPASSRAAAASPPGGQNVLATMTQATRPAPLSSGALRATTAGTTPILVTPKNPVILDQAEKLLSVALACKDGTGCLAGVQGIAVNQFVEHILVDAGVIPPMTAEPRSYQIAVPSAHMVVDVAGAYTGGGAGWLFDVAELAVRPQIALSN